MDVDIWVDSRQGSGGRLFSVVRREPVDLHTRKLCLKPWMVPLPFLTVFAILADWPLLV